MQKSVFLFVGAFIALLNTTAVAQEIDAAFVNTISNERLMLEIMDTESPAHKGLVLEKEIKPRLPNGFGPVVNPAQKAKIYSIQRDYNGLIALLELRIELLKKERDAKIDTVLTPAQLEKVRTRKTGSLSRSL